MKKDNRTSALRIRLSNEEHAAITAVADLQGVGICTFARMVTIRAAGLADSRQKRRKPTELQRAIAQCVGELGRIGNNVNQAVKSLNTGWDCDPAILLEAAAELRALRETIVAAGEDITK